MAIALLLLCLTAPPLAWASGPGVHLLEADRVLDSLAESDPQWAELAELPLARSYLHFGAVSPDFEKATETIPFGHQHGLSYFLLEKAKLEKPEFRLFALGHLCHQGSDGAMEALIVPAFFSSAPIGLYSLFGEYADGRADSEGIIESFGDLVLGDWLSLVDMLFDFWYEDDEAKQRASELFYWYCEAGAEHFAMSVDCDLVKSELEGLLAKADGLVGMMSREEAKQFVQMLIDQPLEELVNLATSGMLTSMLSGQVEPGPEYDAEVERFKNSVFVDPEFWKLYEQLEMLGPAYALDALEVKPPSGSWPIYDANAIRCGNIQSIMNYAPLETQVIVGLTVDQLVYLDSEGEQITEVLPGDEAQTFTARVRFFSALPFEGTVRGAVRKDRPGFDQQGDEILGEADIMVAIDPVQYVTEPRSELEISFVADFDGALGYYVELYADDAKLPWFTTSWDRLWLIEELDFHREIYKSNFGTYGHWPPSLPLAEPDETPAVLFVKVSLAFAGGPVEGVTVSVAGSEPRTTKANGLAVFDELQPGETTIELSANGYLTPGPTQVLLPPLEQTFVELALLVDPAIRHADPYRSAAPRPPVSEAPRPPVLEVPRSPASHEDVTDGIVDKYDAPRPPVLDVVEDYEGEAEPAISGGGSGGCSHGSAAAVPWLITCFLLGAILSVRSVVAARGRQRRGRLES